MAAVASRSVGTDARIARRAVSSLSIFASTSSAMEAMSVLIAGLIGSAGWRSAVSHWESVGNPLLNQPRSKNCEFATDSRKLASACEPTSTLTIVLSACASAAVSFCGAGRSTATLTMLRISSALSDENLPKSSALSSPSATTNVLCTG